MTASNSDYIIRNYRPADFDNYVLLWQEVDYHESTWKPASPQALHERLNHPNYTPEQDLFLIEVGGNLIGFVDILPEQIIRRVILSCWIHPGHRKKRLARRLLGHVEKRAKELEAKVLHANVWQDNELAKSVLEKLGFTMVRRFLDIQLEMDKIQWQDIDKDALGCRRLQPGEEEKLALIQNRAFADHWGYNPNSVEEIVYDANRGDNSPRDIVVTCDGDKLIGYCWTEVLASGDKDSQKKGQIYMIGTDPDYRGTGAGKRVLLAGLINLRNRGIEITTLTVDSENEVALALYESIGFYVTTSTLWYEKILGQ